MESIGGYFVAAENTQLGGIKEKWSTGSIIVVEQEQRLDDK